MHDSPSHRVPTVRGFFVDAHTLGAALTGRTSNSGALAEKLGATPKTSTDEYGGPITTEFLEYAVNDVQVTWECYEKLAQRYASFGLSHTPVHRCTAKRASVRGCCVRLGSARGGKLNPNSLQRSSVSSSARITVVALRSGFAVRYDGFCTATSSPCTHRLHAHGALAVRDRAGS